MTVETLVYSTLKTLVSNRVYRDLAPPTVTDLPRITFVQVGGRALNFVEGAAPSKKNCRMQINCWHSQRDACMALARDVEDALRTVAALHTTVLAAAFSVYEEDTRLYGTVQDFSFWVDD